MGLFNIDPPAQFQRFDPPIGVHLNYCVPWETTLILRERLFSFSGASEPLTREETSLRFRMTSSSMTLLGTPSVAARVKRSAFETGSVGVSAQSRV